MPKSMKLVFLVIPIFINIFNYTPIKAEEKINPKNNTIENIDKKESFTVDKSEIRKVHIVKTGDTVSSISKFYSVNKNSIIKLNNLKDENYIFVGQNLIISESIKNNTQQTNLVDQYHIVQIGENLTDISNKYKLNLGYLIEINNLKNPDFLKVGDKLLLTKKNPISSENDQIIEKKKNNEFLELDRQIYGPLIIQNKSYKKIKGRKILNVINQKNKKLILSVNCDTDELDVRIPGRKWKGEEPAKEEFEKKLINDFC